MSASLAPYLDEVRSELNKALHAMDDPSMEMDSNYPIRPVVELGSGFIARHELRHNAKEYCLLESSKNSVRISFCFKQDHSTDAIEQSIMKKYMRFFQQRALDYTILRRKPVPGYSISFLVLNTHVASFGADTILPIILDFVSKVDRECSQVKISVNARARLIATEFLKAF